jgi:predicted amidophosphoribosyltransferase
MVLHKLCDDGSWRCFDEDGLQLCPYCGTTHREPRQLCPACSAQVNIARACRMIEHRPADRTGAGNHDNQTGD